MSVNCPIPNCNGEFVRVHCLEERLPPVCHDELSGADVTNQRLRVLSSITRLQLDIGRSLSDLIGYLETHGILNLVDPVFTHHQRLATAKEGLPPVMINLIV